MNKQELEKELIRINKLYESEKKNNDYLLKEQKRYVKLAETMGSELNPYKTMVIRLKEELEKLEVTLKLLKR